MTQNLDLVHRSIDRRIDLLGVNGTSHGHVPTPGALAHGRAETLASMLGRTTSLLPNALLTSLGMPRDEDLTDVRHVSVPFPISASPHRRSQNGVY